MPFELHIALRYLLARRRQAFISVISFVSILGVAVGVMALVIALALMTGLQAELRDRILGATAHVFVYKQSGIADYHAEVARLKAIPHVKAAAPAILGKGMLRSQGGTAFITVKGIDPALEATVSDIEKAVVSGKLSDLSVTSEESPDAIFLGKDVAADLAVGVGDSVTLLTPDGSLSPFGMMFRPRTLRVAGIFYMGFNEYDATYGFVSLDVAERIFNRTTPELIQLTVDDVYAAPQVSAAITTALGPQYLASDWTTLNQSLFKALTLGEIRHFHHHRPHRHGGGAEYRGVPGPPGDGEEPGHRHPEDDGRVGAQRDVCLHAAGLIIGLAGTLVGAALGRGFVVGAQSLSSD